MEIRTKLERNTLLLSVLLHLLLLLGFAVVVNLHPEQEEQAAAVIPSFVYNSAAATPVQVAREQKSEQQQPQKPTEETSKLGIKKPVTFSTGLTSRPKAPPLKQLKAMQAMTAAASADPVHLLGDTNQVAKPLIILLGQAITKNLEYPKIAEDFAVHGVVLVGFTLHPDGHLSDIQLVKSSNAEVLDHAAMYAVNEAPHVRDANLYMKEAKYLVVGIVFR